MLNFIQKQVIPFLKVKNYQHFVKRISNDKCHFFGQKTGRAGPITRLQRDQEFSIPGFLGQNPKIPGFFGTGLAISFYLGILPQKCGYGQISQVIWLQMENFIIAILYLVYSALKYMYFEDLWVKSCEIPKMRNMYGM